MIAIVIALNSLHKNFDTTTTSLLGLGNKTIDKIRSILQSKKAKNIRTQVKKVTDDLAMTLSDKDVFKKKLIVMMSITIIISLITLKGTTYSLTSD